MKKKGFSADRPLFVADKLNISETLEKNWLKKYKWSLFYKCAITLGKKLRFLLLKNLNRPYIDAQLFIFHALQPFFFRIPDFHSFFRKKASSNKVNEKCNKSNLIQAFSIFCCVHFLYCYMFVWCCKLL